MERSFGGLKITVLRGLNLAIRDFFSRSSDPYVVLKLGNQRLATKVVKKSLDPVWNEELTLWVDDPCLPIKLEVYDRDWFSRDDKMGTAEIDIRVLMQVLMMELEKIPNGKVVIKVTPSKENCLAEESCIVWENGNIIQHMFLRLRDVECGEIHLQLKKSTYYEM